MKKTLFKKLMASALGMTLIMSMGSLAFADDGPLRAAVYEKVPINILKTMTVSNPDLSSVDGPGMSYSYTISPVTPSDDNGGGTVTDSENRTGIVQAGPEDGVTLTSSEVNFDVGTPLNASQEGTGNDKFFTALIDSYKFPAPGIYRYRISETLSPQDPSAVGVSDSGDRDRYLDVYVENDSTVLAIAGCTLHDKYNNKTDGFNGGAAGPGQPFTGAAQMDTKNIVLEKEVIGNMGDKNNQFPFEGLVKDNGRSFYAKKEEAPKGDASDLVEGSASGTSVSTTLAHLERYYISGLSSAAVVNFSETNNTQNTYSVSIAGGKDSAEENIVPDGKKTMGDTSVNDSSTVKFVNKLDTVTPTGVVLRYSYAFFIIAAGILLVLLRRKSRTDKY